MRSIICSRIFFVGLKFVFFPWENWEERRGFGADNWGFQFFGIWDPKLFVLGSQNPGHGPINIPLSLSTHYPKKTSLKT